MKDGKCPTCGSAEIYVSDTSVAWFGMGKSLKESIPASSNWEKVSGKILYGRPEFRRQLIHIST